MLGGRSVFEIVQKSPREDQRNRAVFRLATLGWRPAQDSWCWCQGARHGGVCGEGLWMPAPNVPSMTPLSASEEVEEWKVVCGKFLAVNATNMSCACPRTPRGLSPAAHLGDGSSDLILIRKCSRFNFLRFLVRHTNQRDQVSGGRPRVSQL